MTKIDGNVNEMFQDHNQFIIVSCVRKTNKIKKAWHSEEGGYRTGKIDVRRSASTVHSLPEWGTETPR